MISEARLARPLSKRPSRPELSLEDVSQARRRIGRDSGGEHPVPRDRPGLQAGRGRVLSREPQGLLASPPAGSRLETTPAAVEETLRLRIVFTAWVWRVRRRPLKRPS